MAIRYGDRSRVSSPVSGWLNELQGPWWQFFPKPPNETGSVSVAANSSAHTKGAWTEIIASTSVDATLLLINVTAIGVSSTNTATLVDVALGSSGNEVAVVSNVAVGGAAQVAAAGTDEGLYLPLPVYIPAGSRISARIQSVVTGGKTATVRAQTFSLGRIAPSSAISIGGNTATSGGVQMSGASGTYVEVIASTAQDFSALSIVPSIESNNVVGAVLTYTLAIGAAGSEVDIDALRFQVLGTEQIATNRPYDFNLVARSIPSGTRLSIKHDIAANPERYAVTLIGVPA